MNAQTTRRCHRGVGSSRLQSALPAATAERKNSVKGGHGSGSAAVRTVPRAVPFGEVLVATAVQAGGSEGSCRGVMGANVGPAQKCEREMGGARGQGGPARANLPGRTCQGEPARARQAPAAKSRLAAVPVPADPALRVLPGTDEGCLRLGQSSACRKQLQNQPQLAGARWRLSDATRCRCPKGGPTASHRAVTEGGHRDGASLLSRPVTSVTVCHDISASGLGLWAGSGPWFLGPRDCQTRAPSLPGLACRNSTAAESRRAWRRRWGHLRAPRDGKPSGRGLTL